MCATLVKNDLWQYVSGVTECPDEENAKANWSFYFSVKLTGCVYFNDSVSHNIFIKICFFSLFVWFFLNFAVCSFCRPCPRYWQAGCSSNFLIFEFYSFPYDYCNVGCQNPDGQGCLLLLGCLYGWL